MSTLPPSPPRKRSRARNFFIGCLVVVLVIGVLAIAGCVGFVIWLGAEGEVTEQTVLLTGGEEVFGSLYLTPDNPALLEFTAAVIERNQQMQDKMGGIGRFLPKQDPDKASRKEIEEVLPLRLEGALYPESSGGYQHLVKAELSKQYRLYGLLFKGAAFMIGTAGSDSEDVRVESLGGVTTIISSEGQTEREHGFAFVGNTFYWASPPSRIASASELSLEAPAAFAPPDARLPIILEDVGGETNPIWALVTGPSLLALADSLGHEGDAGTETLASLLTRTKTVALGLELVDGNTARLRVAGLTPEGESIDEELRGLLSQPIHTESDPGFSMDLACEVRGSERWSCAGDMRGFRDALFRVMDEAESQLDAQRNR